VRRIGNEDDGACKGTGIDVRVGKYGSWKLLVQCKDIVDFVLSSSFSTSLHLQFTCSIFLRCSTVELGLRNGG
jgi:hypothetical protein